MKKGLNQYSIKSFDTSIKDLSLGKREVEMYLSRFDTIDSDNDMIVKGAFEKSIKERGPESSSNRNIAFLIGRLVVSIPVVVMYPHLQLCDRT